MQTTITRLLHIFLAFILSLSLHAQDNSEKPLQQHNVSTGRLEVYPSFTSLYIRARDVAVWLPENYNPKQRYDVVYMHDGQNLFDSTATWNHQEWQIDEVAGKLIREKRIRPCIVVGIANIPEVRLTDYFPQKTTWYVDTACQQQLDTTLLQADNYLRFITQELKPFIDSHYSTRPDRKHTFMMGSSMGGLISLYALCEYPHVFGGVACLSTHVPLAITSEMMQQRESVDAWAAAFCKYVDSHLPKANSRLIYMDRGTVTLDATYAPYQTAIDSLLLGKGWTAKKFHTQVFTGHAHMEHYWAQRVDIPLLFLLGK